MNKYLLMLSCVFIFSCSSDSSADDLPLLEELESSVPSGPEEAIENIMDAEIEPGENEILLGTWRAQKVTIDSEVIDDDRCELNSSITFFSDNIYSDRFFNGGTSGCNPIFVSGVWEYAGDVISLNYNDGRGLYVQWQVLEISAEKIALKSLTSAKEEFWEYSKGE